jgi:hypothetical protein
MAKDVSPRAEEVQDEKKVGLLGTHEVGSMVLIAIRLIAT